MNLLDLPYEILVQIFKKLQRDEQQPYRYYRRGEPQLILMSAVCHRMNELVESHLYKRLHMNIDAVSLDEQKTPLNRFNILVEALRRKPHRCTLVKTLETTAHPSYPLDEARVDILRMLLEECCNVEKLCLKCNHTTLNTPAIFKALDFHKIYTLDLDMIITEEVTAPGKFPKLEKLSFSNIYGAFSDDDDDDDDDDDKDSDRTIWSRDNIPLERQGTSPLQSLHVSCQSFHPCAILPFLWWTTTLKTLYTDFVSHRNSTIAFFTTTQLQSMLNIHSTSLEQINLSAHGGKPIPNFQHFTNLKVLHISLYDLFSDPPEDSAVKLAAPRLSSLTIDFDLEHYGADYSNKQCFENQHSSWLQQFSDSYRSIIPQGGLRDIYLINVHLWDDHQNNIYAAAKLLRQTADPLQSVKNL